MNLGASAAGGVLDPEQYRRHLERGRKKAVAQQAAIPQYADIQRQVTEAYAAAPIEVLPAPILIVEQDEMPAVRVNVASVPINWKLWMLVGGFGVLLWTLSGGKGKGKRNAKRGRRARR